MAFKATKYFVVIVALVLGGTRYMYSNMKRANVNNDVGVWDSKDKDGLRYTIITRSNETGGSYFLAHVYCTSKAGGFYPGKPCGPPMHIHDVQDEEFEVIRGAVMISLNNSVVQLPIGQKTTVPAGWPHTFWNGGSEPIEFLVRLTPGIPDESFLETAAGLARQFGGLGAVNPIQLVLMFAENGLTPTDVPPQLWTAAKTVLVPIAKLIGLSSRYPDYTSKAGQPVPVEATPAPAAAVPAPTPETETAAAPEPTLEPVAVAVAEVEAVAEAVEVAAVEEVPLASATEEAESCSLEAGGSCAMPEAEDVVDPYARSQDEEAAAVL